MSGQRAGAPDALRLPAFQTDDAPVRLVDASGGLQALPPGTADLIFADPPYNLQLQGELFRPNQTRVDGVVSEWDRFDTFAAYDAFTRDWLDGARRALKPNGTMFVIGSYHNIFRVGAALQDVGFWILNDIVWVKVNPMPNFRGRRFTNAHETLIWAVADKRRTDYTFNYRALKTLNDDLQHRSDWVVPLCGGSERVRTPSGAKAHPTQKPLTLVRRAVMAASRSGDLVVDPFAGTGTTGVAARSLGRRFVGFDIDAHYVAMANARIAATQPLDETTIMDDVRRPVRVPFGFLVETGLVPAGATLVGGRERYEATVRPDGSVVAPPHVGSIHKVGAALRGTPSCNGWTYWSLKKADATLVALDMLRGEARRSLA